MITLPPTEERHLFSPEQRRRLSKVYRRILSWREQDQRMGKDNVQEPVFSQLPDHPIPSLNDGPSADLSKGGIHG
jgi:hypothetical protein